MFMVCLRIGFLFSIPFVFGFSSHDIIFLPLHVAAALLFSAFVFAIVVLQSIKWSESHVRQQLKANCDLPIVIYTLVDLDRGYSGSTFTTRLVFACTLLSLYSGILYCPLYFYLPFGHKARIQDKCGGRNLNFFSESSLLLRYHRHLGELPYALGHFATIICEVHLGYVNVFLVMLCGPFQLIASSCAVSSHMAPFRLPEMARFFVKYIAPSVLKRKKVLPL